MIESQPDALVLLRAEAKRRRDKAVEAAEAKYAETLKAIELVAELDREED